MKTTYILCSLLASIFLYNPAFAVNESGHWSAFRNNQAGTTGFAMRPHANHFCFLTQVGIEETDSGGEEARCRIAKLGSDWWIQAILEKSSDADVKCSAYCYTKN
jgi:hypothetical protein